MRGPASATSVHVEFRVLGAVEAVSGGTSLDLGHSRQRSVLAVLLVAANQPVTADQLLDRVWEQYRDFSGVDLSRMTHQPGSPWAAALTMINIAIANRMVSGENAYAPPIAAATSAAMLAASNSPGPARTPDR